MRRLALAIAVLCPSLALAEPTLVGLARLPADTFRPGPTSGQWIDGEHNRRLPPFVDQQPVQGISSLVAADEPGTWYALSDNGFGTKANSGDYLLCVYKVTPNWETGEVAWELAFELSDPGKKVPWEIVADRERYEWSELEVPAVVREKRLLTGSDFDVESMVRLPDGTFWMGDEFGPFLLHFSADGKLLEPPVELPGEGMHSPDHPTKDPEAARIGRSAGFEGLALRPLLNADGTQSDGQMLLPTLEKPLAEELRDEGQDVDFYLVEQGSLAPAGGPAGTERTSMPAGSNATLLSADATAIGEYHIIDYGVAANWVTGERTLQIERDDEQGDAAKVKRMLFREVVTDQAGQWIAERGFDLLDLADPDDLDGDGSDRFRFPYLTIESVAVVDERTVIVCNDNNYPFTDGRPERDGPDETEFLLIRFDRPLSELAAGE